MVQVSPTRPKTGFTLLELAIALAVLALLVPLAWPSYTESVRKGRRSDAVRAATQVQQAQERWLGNRLRYTDQLADLGLPAASPAGHYTLALSAASATGYTLTVTAATGKPQAADSGCTSLTITVLRGQASYAPAACWGS